MTKRSARVVEASEDGLAGVVRDTNGTEYPFTTKVPKLQGDVVLYEVEDRDVGHNTTATFARLDD
jgi:hypothetical protein